MKMKTLEYFIYKTHTLQKRTFHIIQKSNKIFITKEKGNTVREKSHNLLKI